jgi:GT2 family glycosyltransferase
MTSPEFPSSSPCHLVPLTVAISTRDRPDALARCLDSLWAGDCLPAELILVDQSQGHATRDLVEAHRQQGRPIHYIHQEPAGLGASQNLAFAQATHPIVAVIDDDCIADPAWLSTIADLLAADPTLAGVTGRILPLPPEGDKIYPVSTRLSEEEAEFQGKTLPWLVGSGNNFALRRDSFLAIGGCDERLGPGSPGLGGVDMDLFYRLLRAGGRIRYDPRSLVYHERQDKDGRLSRRPLYGHGMGVCCLYWLREKDYYSLVVLTRWFLFRTRLLARALYLRQPQSLHEEALILKGTLQGIHHALHSPRS